MLDELDACQYSLVWLNSTGVLAGIVLISPGRHLISHHWYRSIACRGFMNRVAGLRLFVSVHSRWTQEINKVIQYHTPRTFVNYLGRDFLVWQAMCVVHDLITHTHKHPTRLPPVIHEQLILFLRDSYWNWLDIKGTHGPRWISRLTPYKGDSQATKNLQINSI